MRSIRSCLQLLWSRCEIRFCTGRDLKMYNLSSINLRIVVRLFFCGLELSLEFQNCLRIVVRLGFFFCPFCAESSACHFFKILMHCRFRGSDKTHFVPEHDDLATFFRRLFMFCQMPRPLQSSLNPMMKNNLGLYLEVAPTISCFFRQIPFHFFSTGPMCG